jgi:hypothetical protein
VVKRMGNIRVRIAKAIAIENFKAGHFATFHSGCIVSQSILGVNNSTTLALEAIAYVYVQLNPQPTGGGLASE